MCERGGVEAENMEFNWTQKSVCDIKSITIKKQSGEKTVNIKALAIVTYGKYLNMTVEYYWSVEWDFCYCFSFRFFCTNFKIKYIYWINKYKYLMITKNVEKNGSIAEKIKSNEKTILKCFSISEQLSRSGLKALLIAHSIETDEYAAIIVSL